MEKDSLFKRFKNKFKLIISKINAFLVTNWPSKRRLIQIYALLLYNANMRGFITGDIFTGDSKNVCVPGMNCYSCPGAIGACPLGSIQNALAESKTKAPTYVLGIILLYCIIFGRWICGWLCPGGLFQELLYKIKTPKLKKNRVTRALSYFKYILLIVLVIIIPIMYGVIQNLPLPAFCKYVCPIGTFEGAIFLLSNPNNGGFYAQLGSLFTWKFALLIGFVVGSIFIYRFFCRFFCPLGALYGIFNKLSIIGVKVDKSKCNHCGACVTNCKMDVMEVGDHECIQCGECIDKCSKCAISWKLIGNKLKEEAKKEVTDTPIQINTSELNMEESTNNEELISLSNDNEEVTLPKEDNKFIKFIKKIGNYIKTHKAKVITTTSMLIVLLIAILYSCVWSVDNTLSVNSIINKLDVVVYENDFEEEHSRNIYANNSNVIVIYFYDEYNYDDVKYLEELCIENIQVFAISSYINKDKNIELVKHDILNDKLSSLIKFAYDDSDCSANLLFVDSFTMPYYVWSDTKNTIKYSNTSKLTEYDFQMIKLVSEGETLGYNVGDICYSKDITIIDEKGKDTGEYFNLNNNKGKVSVINFWGYWCTPCKEELPGFDTVYKEVLEEYGDVLDMIAIHQGSTFLTDYDKECATDYIHDTKASFKWGYDDSNDSYFKNLGGTSAYPITIVVNGEGRVVLHRVGKLTESELKSSILSALNL